MWWASQSCPFYVVDNSSFGTFSICHFHSLSVVRIVAGRCCHLFHDTSHSWTSKATCVFPFPATIPSNHQSLARNQSNYIERMARHTPFTILTFVCLVLMALSSVAFMPVRPALSLSKMRAATLSGPSSRSPSGRSKGLTAMSGKYWEGEWVCADCGYIYNEAVRWVGGRERGRDRPTPPVAYFLSLMETFSLLLEPSPLLTLLLSHQCLRLIRPGLRRHAF